MQSDDLELGYMGNQNNLATSIPEDLLLFDFDSGPLIPCHTVVLNPTVLEKRVHTDQRTFNTLATQPHIPTAAVTPVKIINTPYLDWYANSWPFA